GGVISTIAGNGSPTLSGDGGPATSALLSLPRGVAVDPDDNLYVADTGNNVVRKVTPAGVISSVAGTGAAGSAGDGGAATAATLSGPQGVAVDGAGNLYISDTTNNKVRKVDASGFITTYAGTGVAGSTGDSG